MENPADLAVTGNFSITATLPQGKQITMSGYMYDRESIEAVNGRLDLMMEAMERQRQRAEVPELELKRDHLIRQLEAMRDHLKDLLNKQENGKTLTKQEKTNLENMYTSIAKCQADIDKGQVAIDEQKRKTGLD